MHESPSRKNLLFAAALTAATLLAYQPAWHGEFLWDDDQHAMLVPHLQAADGLWLIWTETRATQEYYPLTETAFWLQYRLWGSSPLGYHLVNIVLHAATALLAGVVLRRLAIPGAYLAAAVFALHPVHVESVAWITELKNILSALLVLAAAAAYERFDRTRRRWDYGLALVLYLAALSAKSAIVALPAILLVLCWWRRGTLSWRRDVLPTAPLFLCGLMFGLVTISIENRISGPKGPAYPMTLVEHVIIAGWAAWFYAGKLVWPTHLTFIYPRWTVSQAIWWEYLFPAAAIALAATFWAIRRRTRGPLAGMLFFLGMLFPALAFCNMYGFSFVADHWQYVASLGVIVPLVAGVAGLMRRAGIWNRPAGHAVCLALLAVLAGLTWRQSRMYADVETLYKTTLERNPDCWLCYTNLAAIMRDRGRLDETIYYSQEALKRKADLPEAENNLAAAFDARGNRREAIEHYENSVKLKPDDSHTRNNLAALLVEQGQIHTAEAHFREAVRLSPELAEAHRNYAGLLRRQGRLDEAVAEYVAALRARPDFTAARTALAEILNELALRLVQQGRFDDAIVKYQECLEVNPGLIDAHNNRGLLLAARGRIDEAIVHYRRAVALAPLLAEPRQNLGVALCRKGQFAEALAQWREGLRGQPDDVNLAYLVAWTLATCPDDAVRNGPEALTLADRAVRLCDGRSARVLDAQAAAYAETGRFDEAVRVARRALQWADTAGDAEQSDSIRAHLKLFEAKSPVRDSQGMGK